MWTKGQGCVSILPASKKGEVGEDSHNPEAYIQTVEASTKADTGPDNEMYILL